MPPSSAGDTVPSSKNKDEMEMSHFDIGSIE